jgi:2-polyprenyl-3-methyl-5-hydroxy-6-metoxy-1,4-benzoquinol methylase
MRELTLDRLPTKTLAQLDLETVFAASRAVIAAERLMVFRRLHGKALSAAAVSRRVGIHPRHCDAFLDLLAFLGLLRKHKGLYRNSPLADRHFIHERSADWTSFWSSECSKDYEALVVMEGVLSTGRDWRKLLGRERKPDYQRVREDPQWAREFTYALFDSHRGDAEILARNLDLSDHQALLDVGGGSGVMSIALVRANPDLKACILDFEFVCAATRALIRTQRMSRRVDTLVGDMNRALPSGFDVMLFWDLGHVEARVMKMAWESLPEGGMVVLSCPSSSRSQTQSPGRFMREYLSVRPTRQTRGDAVRSLKNAGFRSVEHRRIGPGLLMITGHKTGKCGAERGERRRDPGSGRPGSRRRRGV